MALSTGQIIHLDQPLSSEVASLVYLWADNIKRSVIIRNRSLAKVQPIVGGRISSGIPTFVHRQRPCVWATIAGIVVGVTPRDRKWEYMIDDGTQIIDITIHERNIPKGVAPSASVSQKASSSRWTLDVPEPDLRIGDLVRVTGKIWRRKRHAQPAKVGIDAVQAELLNTDSTAEARHNLLAHELEQGEYNRPFGVLAGTSASVSKRQGLMHLDEDDAGSEHRTTGLKSYQKLTVGPLPEHSQVSINSGLADLGLPTHSEEITRDLAMSLKRPRDENSRDIRGRQGAPWDAHEDAMAPLLNRRRSPRTRSLRAPSRLSDSECTPSLFRLHVQKILTDHCGDAVSEQGYCAPPSFSLSFLRRVKPLAELSDRIVSILLQKRAQKLAARSRSKKRNGDIEGDHDQPLSSEPKREKVKRLFEWCIRELLVDGFVVIAGHEEVEAMQSPFDGKGKRDSQDSNGNSRRNHKLRKLTLMLDEVAEDDDGIDSSQEAYQLVTPHLLRPAIQRLAEQQSRTRSNPSMQPSAILQLLRKTDERWKHITVESVEEAMVGS